MPVGGDDSSNDTMIERKATEVFGDHNDGEALAFIGTKGTRWHDFPGSKAQ
ncbi:MAG: hypothetical protein WA992_11325 [Desulfobulbales bacterium]